ncbi:MAG: fumarylacetoacetate hydrolase family protein [Actinomycetota bacterium]|nr:fumarylacetoacetate hydrolase family protein [Actinomycetota bacterium]
MTEPSTPETLAAALWDAAETGVPIAPIAASILVAAEHTSRRPDDIAYSIQQLNVERTVAERGSRVCGRKIGLTSAAVQRQLGVDRPDFGALFADRCFGDGETVDISRMLAPRVEPEIALVLGRDLDRKQHTVADILRATDFALTAIEIVDSRIAEWRIGFLDTVADNASGDSFVLGTVPHSLSGLDLADVRIEMSVDGDVVSSGHGRDCFGNPLLAGVWLADTLSSLGTPLRAGDIVMTGAVAAMAPLPSKGTVTADFGPLGNISLNTGVE